MAKKEDKQDLTLAQIQKSLAAIEKQRAERDITPQERMALEEAAVVLREAERSAIKDTQQDIIKDFEKEIKQVSLQASAIRKTVTRLNKLPKALDTTETVIKECVKVLKAIASFLSVTAILTI